MVAKTMMNQRTGVGKADQQQAATTYLEFERHLKNTKLSSSDSESTHSQVAGAQPSSYILTVDTTGVATLNTISSSSSTENQNDSTTSVKCGRWSLNEKLLFLYGLSVYGKGRWKKISAYVPARSLVQIKSHAQKVLKRMDAGENVFLRLEEHCDRLKVLVAEANQRIDEIEEAKAYLSPKNKRKRARKDTGAALVQTWHGIPDKAHAPCSAGSRAPLLSSAFTEDHPGIHASHHVDGVLGIMDRTASATSHTSFVLRGEYSGSLLEVPVAGTGAVIAAVAALCQLSASS